MLLWHPPVMFNVCINIDLLLIFRLEHHAEHFIALTVLWIVTWDAANRHYTLPYSASYIVTDNTQIMGMTPLFLYFPFKIIYISNHGSHVMMPSWHSRLESNEIF